MSEPVSIVPKVCPGATTSAGILRDMASQAERGEIISVTVLYERPDGSVGDWMSETRSATRMAGALLNAAVRRLGFVEG